MAVHNFQDLTGKTFDRWTVIERAESAKGRVTRWLCQCICGTIRVVRGRSLLEGTSRSCGCLGYPNRSRHRLTHGMRRTPEYRIWHHMKQRCVNPKDKSYANYGGRGIVVCERWLNSFQAFWDDMGARPSPKHSIGRINNDWPYSPDNCAWQTQTEQARNTRANRLLTIGETTACLAEWFEISGATRNLYDLRIARGWNPEDAMLTPSRMKRRGPITINGHTAPLRYWLERLGMHAHTFYQRLSKGLSIEETLTQPVRQHRPYRR